MTGLFLQRGTAGSTASSEELAQYKIVSSVYRVDYLLPSLDMFIILHSRGIGASAMTQRDHDDTATIRVQGVEARWL